MKVSYQDNIICVFKYGSTISKSTILSRHGNDFAISQYFHALNIISYGLTKSPTSACVHIDCTTNQTWD